MADFLRLIDVNAGGLRLKKGQGMLHLNKLFLNMLCSCCKCTYCLERPENSPRIRKPQETHQKRVPEVSRDQSRVLFLVALWPGILCDLRPLGGPNSALAACGHAIWGVQTTSNVWGGCHRVLQGATTLLCQVLQTLYSKRQNHPSLPLELQPRRGHPVKHP